MTGCAVCPYYPGFTSSSCDLAKRQQGLSFIKGWETITKGENYPQFLTVNTKCSAYGKCRTLLQSGFGETCYDISMLLVGTVRGLAGYVVLLHVIGTDSGQRPRAGHTFHVLVAGTDAGRSRLQ